MKWKLAAAIIVFLTLPVFTFAQAGEDSMTFELQGVVENIAEEVLEPIESAYQVVEVRVSTDGEHQGELFIIDSREGYTAGLRHEVHEGQKVLLSVMTLPGVEKPTAFLVDVVRMGSLVWVLAVFVLVVIVVGAWRGLASLLSLGVIGLVLFGFILPQILNGANPVLVTLLGSAVILAFAIFVTHGFKKMSLAAFLGTIAGLVITGILSILFVNWAQLTGLGLEEAALLQLKMGVSFDVRGLLLSAIIIGAVGVLDDMAVNQVETVAELKLANPLLSKRELINGAMRVGRHHIASVVNTLVLAYAGVSLPLLLIFMMADQGVTNMINSELIAGEIIRTLVGTIGLILTVPISTVIAASMCSKKKVE